MNGWIIINGVRTSRALFSCMRCDSLWTDASVAFPNFCPFCRATHVWKRDHLPVANGRGVSP